MTNRKGNLCLEMSAFVILWGWKRLSVWVRRNRKDQFVLRFGWCVRGGKWTRWSRQTVDYSVELNEAVRSFQVRGFSGRLGVFSWCCGDCCTDSQKTRDDRNDVDFGCASPLLDRSDQWCGRFEPQHILFLLLLTLKLLGACRQKSI